MNTPENPEAGLPRPKSTESLPRSDTKELIERLKQRGIRSGFTETITLLDEAIAAIQRLEKERDEANRTLAAEIEFRDMYRRERDEAERSRLAMKIKLTEHFLRLCDVEQQLAARQPASIASLQAELGDVSAALEQAEAPEKLGDITLSLAAQVEWLAARQPAQQWILRSEREPTKEDADRFGEVLWRNDYDGAVVDLWSSNLSSRWTHWMCLPAPPPTKSPELIEQALGNHSDSTGTQDAAETKNASMSSEAQRIAIAEACGWTDCNEGRAIGYPRGCAPKASFLGMTALPDYLEDLNAIHEAEKVCIEGRGARIHGEYVEHLRGTVTAGHHDWMCRCNGDMCIYATAAQRAEAFLKTIGKWDAEKLSNVVPQSAERRAEEDEKAWFDWAKANNQTSFDAKKSFLAGLHARRDAK